ncbi:MAG: hypothetical protein K6T85_12540 [Gorillibacterium sp.]|nr:hypothetical protein [Gorillibacterium sp.]
MENEEKTRLTVDIYGTQYKLRGDSSLSYMKRIATLVNDQMHSISSSNERLDTIKIAVLAAVNIADEHLKMREKVDKTTLELERLSASEKEQRAKANQAEEQFELAHNKQAEAEGLLQLLQSEMNELTRQQQAEATRFQLAEQHWTEERAKLEEERNLASSELASLTVRADDLQTNHQLLQESHEQLQVEMTEVTGTLEREQLAILEERSRFTKEKKQLEAQLSEKTQESVKFAERTKEHENVRNSLMQERKSLQEKASTAQAELVKLKQELERSKARVDELNALGSQSRKALEASSTEHAVALKRIKEAHESELQKLRQTAATETESLKNERRVEIRKFQDAHSAELHKLQESHTAEIRDLQGYHAEELLQLQVAKMQELNKQVEAHAAELEESHLRLQEAESYLLEETERLRAAEEEQRQKQKATYDQELERKDVFLAEELERQKAILLADMEQLKAAWKNEQEEGLLQLTELEKQHAAAVNELNVLKKEHEIKLTQLLDANANELQAREQQIFKENQELLLAKDLELEELQATCVRELAELHLVKEQELKELREAQERELTQLKLTQESDAEAMFKDLEQETAKLVAAAEQSAEERLGEQSLNWDDQISRLEELNNKAQLDREEASRLLEMHKNAWDEEKDHLEYSLLVLRTELNQIAEREKQLTTALELTQASLVEQQELVDPELKDKYASLEHEYEMLKKEYNEWIELVMEDTTEEASR